MPANRYKFGPQISGIYPRPDVAGELPDLDVTAVVSAVRAGDPGEVDIDVAFAFTAHDVTAVNPIVEVHAIAYPQGHGIPTDPAVALASTYPAGSAIPPASLSAGGELTVTIEGSTTGSLTIVTVFGYSDPSGDVESPAAPGTTSSDSSTTPVGSSPADPSATPSS